MRRMRVVRGGLLAGVLTALMAMATACGAPPLAVTPLAPQGSPLELTADPSGCAVAAGFVSNGYQLHPELWQSDDCSDFAGRPIPNPCPPGCEIPREGKSLLTGVATMPDGSFLGVGYTEERNDEFPADMVVLRSPDGMTFDDVPRPPEVTDQQTASSVLVTGSGTVLVAGHDGGGRVWRTTDLTSWSMATLPGGGHPEAIARSADGTLVVVGGIHRTADALDRDAAAWVSTDDGQTWTAAPATGPLDPTVGSYEYLSTLINLDDVDQSGWLAIGRDGDRPAVWRSVDGLTWSADDVSWLPPGASLTALAAGDHGLLVAGSVTTEGTTSPAAWLSTDGGATWTERRVDGAGRVTAALAVAQGFALVGGSGYSTGWSTLLVP